MLSRSVVRPLTVFLIVLAAALAGCQTTGRSPNSGTSAGSTSADPGGGAGGGGGGGY
ncbi:hypothetical protein [Ramlibacter henchirensis]|jgi:hypothetical protein|uniref:hypothetical protein n=1 Tax=Ramlibacter henchirensis TaxID=204072 RepID=UPI00142F7A00|nr:hypothetical protein [Ramlibacter henchirensis]